ncbi:MAG: Stp1/IreP family PP2C-type Ser/Thr phosphatase [Atopococcus tabaci]|uniref:Stp1/IreP family PP2C-type Ser/Thr phosphatase n=1 Tax=Atopococcus tabaci TaxID=269774 RepID=A0AA43RNK5_9LACT|nr:Stp1/IreP family PP2C-type Ser/Thr phosphatase [Atopococcus tabaci]
MEISIETSIGNVRKENQDYSDFFVNSDGHYLLVLCDGMGGHQGGDIASEMAVNQLGNTWKNDSLATAPEAAQWLETHLQIENERIYNASVDFDDLEGMGTTIVAAIFIDGQCVIASVGDSRAYLFQDGILKQVTEDDTFVNELVKKGEISKSEALTHPKRNILVQSLGVDESLDIHISKHAFFFKDLLILASDGLYEGVSVEDMLEVLQDDYLTLEDKTKKLTTLALRNYGKDNTTVCIAKLKESEVID